MIAAAMVGGAAPAEGLASSHGAPAPAKAPSEVFAQALQAELKTQAAKHGRPETRKAPVPLLGLTQQDVTAPLPQVLRGLGAGAQAAATHLAGPIPAAPVRILLPAAANLPKPPAAEGSAAAQAKAPSGATPAQANAPTGAAPAQATAPSAAATAAKPGALAPAQIATLASKQSATLTSNKPTTLATARIATLASNQPVATAATDAAHSPPLAAKLVSAAKSGAVTARSAAAARTERPAAALAASLPAAAARPGGKTGTEALTAAELSAGTKGMRGESNRITADKQSQAVTALPLESQPSLRGSSAAGLSREVSVQIAEAARAEAPHIQQGGASMVRIALTPPQLGHVSVTLRAGADGLSATLQAEEPAAAALLQLGQGELRQKLEALGLGPAHVKVSVHDESQAVRPARRSSAGGRR